MLSTRFENAVMTTFSIMCDKKKHFLIDECILNEREQTTLAKRFCKQNKMLFQSIELHKPYEVGPWQHSPIYGFDAECLSNSQY